MAAIAVAVPTVGHLAAQPTADAGTTGGLRSGGPTAGSGTSTQDQEENAQRLLDGMAAAASRGDEEAFLRAAAPLQPAARTRLRAVFRNLRALPLASITVTRDLNRTFGVSVGAGGAFTLPATATYQLEGWDSAPVAVPLLFVVAPSGKALGVVEERTVTDDQTAVQLEPWLFPDLEVVTERHVLVLGERKNSARLRRLATTLERLVGDVRRVWPGRTWNGRVVVYAMTGASFVASWRDRIAADGSDQRDEGDESDDKASFVAEVATLSLVGTERVEASAVRMVVTPYLLEEADPVEYVDVLRHELTHVATAEISPGLPVWLVEGAAEYTSFARGTGRGAPDAATVFERRGRSATVEERMEEGTWRPSLERGPRFYSGTDEAVDGAYDSAFVTCLFIADRYGERALRRLYERAAEIALQNRLQPAVTEITEETALREVLRTDRRRLTRDVARFATRLARR